MYPSGKIVVAFQPHLFSRTKDHLHEFAAAFSQVDKVLLAPIYAAREIDDGTISSQILKEVMGEHSGGVHVFDSLEELKAHAEGTLQKGDVFMTMGAGNIYEIGEQMIKA